jgi:hypothetical protein
LETPSAACRSRNPPLRDSQSSAALTRVPDPIPLQALLVASAVASARAACPSGTSLDTSIEHFPTAHRIATDDSAYGASEVTVASDFSVHYDTYFKVVRTHCGPHAIWGCVPRTYVLTLCGATAPEQYANGTALPADAKHFTIPVEGVALPGSTPVTFLEMLDLRDAIELLDPTYVHSPCLQHLEETEQIDTTKNEYGTTTWAARAAAHEDVQVVFTDSWGTGASGTDKDVVFDATADPGALARAEWIKFISVFFNAEEKANLYFAREKAAFEATSASTASLSASLYGGESASAGKTCAWVQKYDDWYTGATEYHVSYTTYKQELCVGAGMTPAVDAADLSLTTPAYKMVFTNVDDFHAKLKTYDVIIDETYQWDVVNAAKDVVLDSLGVDPDDVSASLKPGALLLRTDGHVTDAVTNLTDANGNAMDWYESAVARPALVLADLAHRAWPEDIAAPPAGCARYFRDVLAGEMPVVNGKDECDVWTAAENEQMCLNNPVLAWDAELEANAASKTIGAVTAMVVGAVAAMLVA